MGIPPCRVAAAAVVWYIIRETPEKNKGPRERTLLKGGEVYAFGARLGLARLEGYGLKVKFTDNALRGREALRLHPEARAADLLQAFRDPEVDMILCAIGGDDTYRLLPSLFGHGELEHAVSGKILGGCLDTLYDLFDGGRYPDSPALCREYGLFPPLEDWRGKILLLETSEEQPAPEKYRRMVEALKGTGVFDVLSGVLVGKPMDEKYSAAYQRILVETVDDPALPILWNLNVGHATPRCILPLGIPAEVDAGAQYIRFGGSQTAPAV